MQITTYFNVDVICVVIKNLKGLFFWFVLLKYKWEVA